MRPALVIATLIFSILASAQTEETEFGRYTSIQKRKVQKEKESLTLAELSTLFKNTATNPVAKLSNLSKYDPTGIIGFCYGRAMTAQLNARKVGVRESSIKKLFIIGAMCSDPNCNPEQPEWRFHVTTIVRGPRNYWYAIDPIVYDGGPYRPLTVNSWIERIRKDYDTFHKGPPRTRLYVANVETIMPDIRTLDSPEKGDKVIELNFNPEDNGIPASSATNTLLKVNSEIALYNLSQTLSQKYFLTLDEEEANRFSFLDIKINGESYPYNGYFVDLFTNLERGPIMARGSRERKLGETAEPAVIKGDLGSFRFAWPSSNK